MLRRVKQALTFFFSWLAALLILFEEWGWEPLARALGVLGRLPFFAWLERRIARLPPYAALAVFFVPALGLLPVKVAALWLIGAGRPGLGLVVILVAKVAGTAMVARIFMLTRDSLMQLAWFARLYARWSAFKERLIAMARASAPWREARRLKAALRRLWRRRS